MMAAHTYAVALSVLLTQPIYALDPGGQPATRVRVGTVQMACPAEEFSASIHAFSNDVTIQKAFTKYPLKYQWLDNTGLQGPKPVT